MYPVSSDCWQDESTSAGCHLVLIVRRLIFAIVLAFGIVLSLMRGSSDAGLNPASPGLPAVDCVYSGSGALPNNQSSVMCVSCHTFTPTSNSTSHFVINKSGTSNHTTTSSGMSTKERLVAWTGSGGFSRYGNPTTFASDNGVSGEMICESCHSIKANVAGGNHLLEQSSASSLLRPTQPNTLTSDTSNLCEGCHVTGTLPGHHPMTGDTVTHGGRGTVALSTVDDVFTRGFTSATTEMGGVGSQVFYPAANNLPCLSCHGNGHRGAPSTGARLLLRGYSREPLKVGWAVVGVDNTGIDRQVDYDLSGATRLITNFTPLCDSCHKVSD